MSSVHHDRAKSKPSGRAVFFLWAFFGFLIAFTPLFAIIHECGHLLAGQGVLEIHLKDWSTVTYRGTPTVGFLMAGWSAQFMVWLGLWALNQHLSHKHPNPLFDVAAGFAWGYVNGTIINAIGSQDFLDIQRIFGWSAAEVNAAWLVFTVPIVAVGWLIVWNCLKEMW